MNEITEVRTFGDTRQLILQTIMQIRDGGMDIQQGMTVAALMKTMNDNIQCEINAVKVAILAEQNGHNFGKIMTMGRKMIGNKAEEDAPS